MKFATVPTALALLGAASVAWNLNHGSRLASLPGAGRGFRSLSGLCAFLLLPALVIGVLAPTASGARVLEPLAWLWPLVAVGMATQAGWALFARRASVLVAGPIALLDLLVACIAVTRWLEELGVAVPTPLLAPGVAVSGLGAWALGDGAYLWSATMLVPLLVPATRARWRLGGAWRAMVAALCTMLVVGVGLELPGAHSALTAQRALGEGAMPERARNEFAVGLRLFGTLDGAPSWTVARHDVALADSLGVTVVQLELSPEGATASALDSMARTLEGHRDAMALVVTLDLASGDGRVVRPTEAWLRSRTELVERIVRQLRPDVLLPANGLTAALDGADVAWWQSYYALMARAARRADRNVAIALATDAHTAADSALSDWVMSGDAPVSAIALSVRSYAGEPERFTRALAAMSRWVSLATVTPTVWLVGVPSSPAVSGELAQQRLVRHALLWGASRAWVRGVIAGDASDVRASAGLRTATGRSRRALADVGAALRALRDAPGPVPIAPDALRVSPDSIAPETP